MSAMASEIIGITIVYSTVCSGAYQRKHQSSGSLAFVRGLYRWPVNSSHKGPVKRKMFPFDDVIISWCLLYGQGLTKHHSCRDIEKLICMTWLHTHAVASMMVQWWRHQMDDVIKWKHFPRYWPFVRGIHRSQVNSPHKGQWRGSLMFSLICTWINGWVNHREAGDLRRHRARQRIAWWKLWHRRNRKQWM